MEKGRKMNKGIVICGFEGTKTKYNIFTKTFNRLDLVNERIYPHYNKISTEQRIKTEKYENEFNIKITRLNDGEFILKKIL